MFTRLLRSVFVSIVVFSLMLTGAAQDEPVTLTVLTHDSFNVSEEVLAEFEAETGIQVQFLRSGDAGQVVNQAVLTAGNPLGDVLFGVDNTFLSRALEADIFVPYESPLLEQVPDSFKLDEEFRVTPIDYGDVCLNYDVQYFAENGLELPSSLAELTDPAYRGLLVVQNPATSSPGLAFLLTTIEVFGTPEDDEDGYTYLNFWEDLIANDVLVTDGWSDAYFTYFTAGSEQGTYPLVVSYASSPPFTVDEETGEASTRSIVAENTCFRQIEFAGILRGTEHEEEAQAFIDFMLSEPFQEDVPLQMFVFPVNEEAELPTLFAEHAQIPENPVVMDPSSIDEGRETWIEAWTEVLLQ